MRSPIQVRTQKKQPNQKNSSDSNANKPSSSSGNLRIKVRLSDNRTDIMELAKGTAVKPLFETTPGIYSSYRFCDLPSKMAIQA